MKDVIAVGTLAGVLAFIAFGAVDWLLTGSLGANYTAAWEAGASIYLDEEYINTPFGIITGLTSSLVLCSSIGVITAIVIRITGKEYYLLKGIGVSLLWRLGTFGILAPIAGVLSSKDEPFTQFIAYMNFIVIGIVVSYVIAKYMKQPRKKLKNL